MCHNAGDSVQCHPQLVHYRLALSVGAAGGATGDEKQVADSDASAEGRSGRGDIRVIIPDFVHG